MNYGVYGRTDSEIGHGVFGQATALSGTSYGVRGESDSTDGYGVYGRCSAKTGTNYGVYGETDSERAYGVYGVSGGDNSFGVGGEGQVGVIGRSAPPRGTAVGVVGEADGSLTLICYGVLGQAVNGPSGFGYGVFGVSDSPMGAGVWGHCTATSGDAIGVLGQTDSPDGYAGYFEGARNYFEGNVGIGTTVPDHPLHVEASGFRAIVGTTSSDVTGSAAIRGRCNAATGSTYAVYGLNDSEIGLGVYGVASDTGGTNFGVLGRSDSSNGYDFYASGAGQDYGTNSSRRWKRNIVNIDYPLEKIAQLRGVYFDWDEDHGGHHDVGFVAEEVGDVLPEIVVYEENGVDAHGMDYSKMTPLLVEALNALRTEKDEEIALLRAEKDAQIEALLERISRLEAAATFMESHR